MASTKSWLLPSDSISRYEYIRTFPSAGEITPATGNSPIAAAASVRPSVRQSFRTLKREFEDENCRLHAEMKMDRKMRLSSLRIPGSIKFDLIFRPRKTNNIDLYYILVNLPHYLQSVINFLLHAHYHTACTYAIPLINCAFWSSTKSRRRRSSERNQLSGSALEAFGCMRACYQDMLIIFATILTCMLTRSV